jgi:chromosome segregation ATPase
MELQRSVSEMDEMAKDFDLQLEKLQHDFLDQEEAMQRSEEQFGNMHDTVVELDGQKALLLDEITELRLQLDREKSENESFSQQGLVFLDRRADCRGGRRQVGRRSKLGVFSVMYSTALWSALTRIV